MAKETHKKDPAKIAGAEDSELKSAREIEFHYIKSNAFRVVHCDGAWGGITPAGLIELNLYSERRPIPQIIKVAVSPDGTLGDETARQTRKGLIREIEVGAVMSLGAAKALVDWLQTQIAMLENISDLKQETK